MTTNYIIKIKNISKNDENDKILFYQYITNNVRDSSFSGSFYTSKSEPYDQMDHQSPKKCYPLGYAMEKECKELFIDNDEVELFSLENVIINKVFTNHDNLFGYLWNNFN